MIIKNVIDLNNNIYYYINLSKTTHNIDNPILEIIKKNK